MGLNFRKSIKIAPGIRVNVSKRAIKCFCGWEGARVNVSKKGTRTTVGIPGTGLSYSNLVILRKTPRREPDFNNPDNVWGYPKSGRIQRCDSFKSHMIINKLSKFL